MANEYQTELNRINQNIADTYSVLNDAGAATPTAANSENLASTAASISAVLYNKSQSLSDVHKAQARANIGALAESELDNAVNDALEQAKESGDFKGETGATGPTGPAGTSVTVSSVSESTADGGTNEVTFSDGKKLNIKNGSKGSTGDTGPRGYYFTPAVSSDGALSWTNNGGLTNPVTVNIKGPKGDAGDTGPQGPTGAIGAGVKSMTYNASTNKWTVTLTDNTTITVDGPAIPNVSGYMPKSGGTFTGAIYAMNGVGTEAQLRNTAQVTTETYPNVDGQINWLCE